MFLKYLPDMLSHDVVSSGMELNNMFLLTLMNDSKETLLLNNLDHIFSLLPEAEIINLLTSLPSPIKCSSLQLPDIYLHVDFRESGLWSHMSIDM